MAAKVNTKFVLILAFVMISLFAAVAATAIFVIKKSGDDYIRLGDAKATANDWKGAQEYYSKAVYKEQGNVKYLVKWLAALRKWTPPTQTQLEDAYQTKYISCLRQIAIASKTDVAAWQEYLGTINRMLTLSPFSRDGYENLITQTTDALKYFEGSAANPQADRLRRYPGLAVIRQMRENLLDDRAKEQIDKGLEDLQAALKADPADAMTLMSIKEWNLIRAERARRAGQNEEAVKFYEASAKATADFLAANPNEPMAWIMDLSSGYDTINKKLVGKTLTPKLTEELNADLAELRPKFAALAEKMRTVKPEQLTTEVLDFFQSLERFGSTSTVRFEVTQQLAAKAMEARPDDFELMVRIASLLEVNGKYAESIAELQKLIDLPPRPVSLESVRLYSRKVSATYQQAVNSFRLNEMAKDEKAKADTLAQARKYREDLGKLMPADAIELKYIDACIAMATRDLMSAQKLLVDYNRSTDNRNPEALGRLAAVAMQLNQPGVARQQYEAILDHDRDNINALKSLIALETSLQNFTRAMELCDRALALNKDDAALIEQKKLLTAMMPGGKSEVSDPVVKALIDSDLKFRGSDKVPPDPEGSMKILRDALAANPGEQRLSIALMQRLLRGNDLDGALAVWQTASQKHPEDETLKMWGIRLTEKDPLTRELKANEIGSDSELDKTISLYSIYTQYEKKAEAAAALEKLKKMAPEDPRVVEIQFVNALQAKDIATARQFAQLAEQRDLDKVNGLTFKARLLIADNKSRDAIIALEEAAQKGVLNQATWLLLARLEIQNGRGADAVKSYTSALNLQPKDVSVIKERIRALIATGQTTDALAAARDGEKYASGDKEFDNLLLGLESQVGNRQLALQRRLEIAQRDPKNLDNQNSLADIYIDLGQYAEAKKVVEASRAISNSLELTIVDARLHAEQNDIVGASKVFEDYLATIDEKSMTSRPWMVFGQFLVRRGASAAGLKVLDQGRKYQDPKLVEVDKLIGDTCAGLNMMDRAADAFKRVVDAGADTDSTYRKRMIEALGKTAKYAEAEKELAAMGDAVDKDPVLLMLKAEMLRGKKDFRDARDTLDRTIQRYPSDFMPYIRRAQLLSEQTGADAEVVADLEAALRVNPQCWQASMLLSSFYAQHDRIPDAVKYARMTLRMRPDMTDFFQSVTRELLRRGDEAAAVDVADDLLRSRSNDAMLLTTIGEIFREAKNYRRSIDYFRQALALSKQSNSAVNVVTTVLLANPPMLDEAEAAIRSVSEQVERDPVLLLIRADVQFRRGKLTEAENDITSALKIIPRDNPNAILAWFLRSRALFKDPAKHMAYLEKLRTQGAMVEWFTFFKAAVNVDRPKPEEKEEGIKQLESVIQSTTNPAVATLSHRMRTSTFYSMKRYQDAVDAAAAGLEKFPDDWELNNNFAFISAKFLNKPAEALPKAEAATKGSIGSPDAWDTLGWIQLMLNKTDEAETSLAKALGLAGPTAPRIPIQIHLAEVAVRKKNKALAEERAKDAEATMKLFPSQAADYQPDLEAVKKLIEAM